MTRTNQGWIAAACALAMMLSPAGSAAQEADEERPGLTVEECVAAALRTSALVEEAGAKVAEWEARLREVSANYYPKLQATAFAAPMFTVEFTDINSPTSVTRWERLEDWGPSLNLEGRLIQPVFSFGRIEAGKEAAEERMLVEQARLREVRTQVAMEVRRFYYLHLYAQSMLPSLNYASELLAEARERADELYAAGTGELTQVDMAKLSWGAATVGKFQVRAMIGAKLALAALRQAMGWPEDRPLVLAADRLPRSLPESDPPLAVLIAEAAQNRPEWAQIEHGQKATLALANAELLANLPVVALVGQLQVSWTPTVDDTRNYYHFDPFNQVFGGVAVALQFDLDPWRSFAREAAALAQHEQIQALHRFAATGIPLQVRKAHLEMMQARELVELAKQGTKATQRWLTFAAASFGSGTGDARDVLEGLAAYLEAKNGEYEALRDYYLSQAELDWAVGRALRPAP